MNYLTGGRNLPPKFMPISFVRRGSRLWGASGHLALQQGKSLCPGMLSCRVPWWPQSCKFVSRSDLIPISFWSRSGCWPFLWFLPYLVLQARISFCSVSDRSGALLLLPCSHKNAVAYLLSFDLQCFLQKRQKCWLSSQTTKTCRQQGLQAIRQFWWTLLFFLNTGICICNCKQLPDFPIMCVIYIISYRIELSPNILAGLVFPKHVNV